MNHVVKHAPWLRALVVAACGSSLAGCAWHGGASAAGAAPAPAIGAAHPALAEAARVAETSPVREAVLFSAFELPAAAPEDEEPVQVTASAGNILDAEGAYGQPGWTMRRRWARTRSYVIDEGQLELEQWWRYTHDRGEGPGHLFQTEIGYGLGNRMQVDLYVNNEHESPGPTKYIGLQPEFRYAFADWGELPLNPTIYLEYKYNHHANDVFEAKLLFAEDLSACLHWGMNLSVEQEINGEREQELAITQAISHDVSTALSIGAEFEWQRVTAKGGRDDPEHALYFGPSIQWRPTENVHVDLVPLWGFRDAHDHRIFLVIGYDFGGAGARHGATPVSAKSK